MPWSRELNTDPGVPRPNPRLLDGAMASYQIFIKHVLPRVPKGAKQVWQVVKCDRLIIDLNCKATFDTDYIVDIVNIGKRKKIGDDLAYLNRRNLCFVLEICTHTIGFDDGKSNFAEQTNKQVTRRLARRLLRKMKGPKATFHTYYYYRNPECDCDLGILNIFPPGEALSIEGIGTFPRREEDKKKKVKKKAKKKAAKKKKAKKAVREELAPTPEGSMGGPRMSGGEPVTRLKPGPRKSKKAKKKGG